MGACLMWMTPREQRDRARELRGNLTKAERVLWRRIRYRQIFGHKFRRQAPIGPFIVDFLCVEQRLVIELDGGQHGMAGGQASDAVRDRVLAAQGFAVLRFWNNEVAENLDGVLERIAEALRKPPA